MFNFFYDYILFILEIVTILFFFLILFFLLYFIKKNKNDIFIDDLNKKYFLIQKNMCDIIFDKNKKKNFLKKLYFNYKFLKKNKQNLFVIVFDDSFDDEKVFFFRKLITYIIFIVKDGDEVLLKLNSVGGFVNKYGLLSNELERLRKHNIYFTVSVDLAAASGGYLMASVANKIIASEFAIIGSIGVLGIVPNFNKFFKKNNIDIEYHTAGKYKSMLNIFTKNTVDGRVKFITSLNITKTLFENFLKKYRVLDIDKVANGEYWYGICAINLNLIDKIQTSEEFIFENLTKFNIYELCMLDKFNNKNIFNSLRKFFL